MDLFFVTCQFAKLCRRVLDQFMPGLYGYDVFGTETVTLKVDLRCFKLHYSYPISFDLSKIGEFFWN